MSEPETAADAALTKREDGKLLNSEDVAALAIDLRVLTDQVNNSIGEARRTQAAIALMRKEQLEFRLAIEQVQTLVRDALALERQRLARERDQEHQEYLRGTKPLPRRPELTAAVDLSAIWTRLEALDKKMNARRFDPAGDPMPLPPSAAQPKTFEEHGTGNAALDATPVDEATR